MGTLHGVIEGGLRVSPNLRTLDYLNRNVSRFVTMEDARAASARWHFEGTVVRVNASTILWVAEIEAMRPGGRRIARGQLNRSAVRLCFADCEVLGFLHTPVQGDPLARLNNESSTFIALTSASMIGSDSEFAAAFLAVNRLHVFAAETLADEDPAEDLAAMAEEVDRP